MRVMTEEQSTDLPFIEKKKSPGDQTQAEARGDRSHPPQIDGLETESGIPCIDPGGGGWFGRTAEQSPLTGYEPKNLIEISSQHTPINFPSRRNSFNCGKLQHCFGNHVMHEGSCGKLQPIAQMLKNPSWMEREIVKFGRVSSQEQERFLSERKSPLPCAEAKLSLNVFLPAGKIISLTFCRLPGIN